MEARNKTILWVDDQIEYFGSYCEKLESEDFIVMTAPSADIALEIIKKEKIDIFLIDLRMPEIDGIDLLRKLNEQESTKNSILAAYSSYHYLPQYKNGLKALGFPVQLIDKDFPPIDSPELYDRFIAPITNLSKTEINITK